MKTVEIEKLIKVSTYAKQIDKSVVWVHQLIRRGEIDSVKIDGVTFIKL